MIKVHNKEKTIQIIIAIMYIHLTTYILINYLILNSHSLFSNIMLITGTRVSLIVSLLFTFLITSISNWYWSDLEL